MSAAETAVITLFATPRRRERGTTDAVGGHEGDYIRALANNKRGLGKVVS